MVYIHRMKVGKEFYYTLRVSKRKEGKVITKDIAYLGSDPKKISEQIDKLPKKFSKEIRKSYRTIKKFLDKNNFLEKIKCKKLKKDYHIPKDILEEIEAAKLHFNEKFLKLDKLTQEEIWNYFIINFVYNSTKIEGNTITLKEAENLLKHEKTPKNKDLREIYDIQNEKKVFEYLIGEMPNIDEKLIIKIHDNLMKNIDLRLGYKKSDNRVTFSRFKTSPAEYVRTDINILLKWFERNKRKLHPLALSILFHHKFEKIHPFADGNGRTGRMIMNYILIKNKYPPLIVRARNSIEYYESLNLCDKSDLNTTEAKPYVQLIYFLSSELINTYWNNFLF